MAKNKNGIMGTMSGKIGTVVGCVDKYGRNYFRARDVSVVNPRTPAQQAHRNKIGTLSKMSVELAPTLRNSMLYHGNELKTTPRNAFIKANMKAYDGTPESLIIGYGELAKPLISILDMETTTPRISVDLPEPDRNNPDLRVALCLFCAATMEAKHFVLDADGLYETYNIPQEWLEYGYNVYAVTVNMNTATSWLGSQFVSGGRTMQPYETSDTTTIAIKI
jgi:hypothetical protein